MNANFVLANNMGFTTMEKLSHKCIGKECLICIIKSRRKVKFRRICELASAMLIKLFNFTNRVTSVYLRHVKHRFVIYLQQILLSPKKTNGIHN